MHPYFSRTVYVDGAIRVGLFERLGVPHAIVFIILFTAGFNVETLSYKKVNFTSWDVGGRCMMVSCFLFLLCRFQCRNGQVQGH